MSIDWGKMTLPPRTRILIGAFHNYYKVPEPLILAYLLNILSITCQGKFRVNINEIKGYMRSDDLNLSIISLPSSCDMITRISQMMLAPLKGKTINDNQQRYFPDIINCWLNYKKLSNLINDKSNIPVALLCNQSSLDNLFEKDARIIDALCDWFDGEIFSPASMSKNPTNVSSRPISIFITLSNQPQKDEDLKFISRLLIRSLVFRGFQEMMTIINDYVLDEAYTYYTSRINTLAAEPYRSYIETTIISVPQDAADSYYRYLSYLSGICASDDFLCNYLSSLRSYPLKLATLLWLFEGGDNLLYPGQVFKYCMESAISIVDLCSQCQIYFIKAYMRLTKSNKHEIIKKVKDKIFEKCGNDRVFSSRDISRYTRYCKSDVGQILELLESQGIIVKYNNTAPNKRGRPCSQRYIINKENKANQSALWIAHLKNCGK